MPRCRRTLRARLSSALRILLSSDSFGYLCVADAVFVSHQTAANFFHGRHCRLTRCARQERARAVLKLSSPLRSDDNKSVRARFAVIRENVHWASCHVSLLPLKTCQNLFYRRFYPNTLDSLGGNNRRQRFR